MKSAVLIKQVPDTETKIRIKGDASGIETDGIKYVVNPYDEHAIEEAIKTKGKCGGEVVVISMGPPRVVEAIRTALAMGADRGIHIDDTGISADSFVTAKVLAAALQKEGGIDLVLCGKQAIDGDCAQVAQIVAESLGWPQVMIASKFDLRDDKTGAVIQRRIGGGSVEAYDISFPCVIGAEKGLNTPRYASLPGIMKAKTKPLQTLKAAELLGEPGSGEAKPKVSFVNYRLPPERKAGRVLQGEPAQVAAELVKLLREEAKVI